MPIIADIKIKIEEFVAAMRRILEYFEEVRRAAKETGKSMKDAFSGSQLALTNTFSANQQKPGRMFSSAGWANIADLLSGITKAFQGGTFAAEGFVATGLNMVSRAFKILGPEFALVIGATFAFAVALKALGATINFTVDQINKYQQTAAKAAALGIQTRTLIVLEEAFKRVGGDAYAASTALDKFYANLYAAKDGATDVYNALRVLSTAAGENLLPVTLLKMGNEQALLKTISALQQVTNETQRLAIANKLFTGFTGTSGLYLKAIIDKSSLEKARQDLGKLLNVQQMTGGGTEQVAEYFKGLFSIISTGAAVAGRVLGSLFAIIPQLESQFASTGLTLTGGLSGLFEAIAVTIENLRPIFEPIIRLAYSVVTAVVQIAAAIARIAAIITDELRGLIDAVTSVAVMIAKVIKTITFGLVDVTAFGPSKGLAEKKPAEPGGLIPAFAPVQAAIASSLTKVGGGGESFGAGGNDPLYDLGRQQLEVQRQIRDSLRNDRGQSGADINFGPMVYQ